jgi:peptide chain release factor 2
MAAPDFWQDQSAAREVLRRANDLKAPLAALEDCERLSGEVETLLELGSEAPEDAELADDLNRDLPELEAAVGRLEVEVLLNGPYDHGDALVAIHPGAGGTESQDWAAMLLRMYTRWAERHRFQVEVLDLLEGEEAGIKSATLAVRGTNAYGFLHAEKGVHRLVRISPFDASGRRHTSFASVDVLPALPDDDSDIEVRPEDLRVDTYRSSGAGGQHVNKTESAIRLTHIPTGIVVACQNERSQHANRATAMMILRARLAERRAEAREREIAAVRGVQGEIAFGSQIRSYVFQPYSQVKDHRTEVEVGSVQAVMDGDIDAFISAFLVQKARRGSLVPSPAAAPADAAAARGS